MNRCAIDSIWNKLSLCAYSIIYLVLTKILQEPSTSCELLAAFNSTSLPSIVYNHGMGGIIVIVSTKNITTMLQLLNISQFCVYRSCCLVKAVKNLHSSKPVAK